MRSSPWIHSAAARDLDVLLRAASKRLARLRQASASELTQRGQTARIARIRASRGDLGLAA
jgi:hypothetical protein